MAVHRPRSPASISPRHPFFLSLSLLLSLSPPSGVRRSPGCAAIAVAYQPRYRPVDYNAATINKFVSDKRGNRKGPYISEPHKATHGEQYFSTVAMRETGSNFNRTATRSTRPSGSADRATSNGRPPSIIRLSSRAEL